MGRQRGQDRDQIAALGRRQTRRRLVEKYKARRAGERERDFKLALLAMRQLADQTIGNRFQMSKRIRSVTDCMIASRALVRMNEKRPRETPRQAR